MRASLSLRLERTAGQSSAARSPCPSSASPEFGAAGGAAVSLALSTGSLSLLGFGFRCCHRFDRSIAFDLAIRRGARPADTGGPRRACRGRIVGVALVVPLARCTSGTSRCRPSSASPARNVHSRSDAASGVGDRSAATRVREAAGRRPPRKWALRGDSVLTLVAGLLAVVGLISILLTKTSA